jgi:hypothetical protein
MVRRNNDSAFAGAKLAGRLTHKFSVFFMQLLDQRHQDPECEIVAFWDKDDTVPTFGQVKKLEELNITVWFFSSQVGWFKYVTGDERQLARVPKLGSGRCSV